MPSARDANWIDGLRGVASFVVVTGHLVTAFAPHIHSPAPSPSESPALFQLPILRLCAAGRGAVALFLLITGYVNAIGPISKSRAGNADAAFVSIARSALARTGRLVLPTAIATLISWFLANVNAYHMTMHVDATWIRQGWHRQEPTVWAAVTSLVHAQISTWTTGWNEYDGTQWSLIYFLIGSMIVYMTMVATVLVTPRARKVVYVVLFSYAWMSGQDLAQSALTSMCVAVGMFVAELHNEHGASATSVLPTPLPATIILLGMFLCSYPTDAVENAPWSSFMAQIMKPVVPNGADIRRYWDTIGASLILLGCFFSTNARRLLSSSVFNFLGRVSFPVYLLHNTLIKSVLTWMVYLPSAMNPPHNEKGEQMDLQRGSTIHILIAVVVFYYLLYRIAWYWTLYIDPLCARAVKVITSWAYGDPADNPNHAEKPILIT
ncbi:hypothetical protein H2201_005092 [Coniosporium apollinis]|uniref:Acyltransferase 3 domain-containing protein n=2 Tax=Coniosporium TaxID=2810619 RepID=A0ABQ9NT87_9PEZI|nr:hypothetical protein H2199_000745 [Cladosporium sp. JES 115]KAJ9664871.1 hypothetical protein H2201_005092 [Coniosporium apollinis]